MPKKTKTTCAYCGIQDQMTRDHVVPRCLFTPPLPLNLITIPTCEACNNKKSKNDDFLRDYLTSHYQSNESHIAKRLFRGKVVRSAIKGSSVLLKTALAKGRIAPIYSKGGVYLGQHFSFPLDGNRLKDTLSTIVQGLSFYVHKNPLLKEHQFRVVEYEPWHFKDLWNEFSSRFAKPEEINQGSVFRCMYILSNDSVARIWLLQFYESVGFSVVAAPSETEMEQLVEFLG